MSIVPEHFRSAFFVLGLLVVLAYAWKQFNEPSFPNKATLPQAVAPLRYLFLRPSYRRARFTYVVVSVLLYCLLVWPGPAMVPLLGELGAKDFPAEAWALIVALVLVGLIPNSNQKWLTSVEEALRRSVHAWFLVPSGIVGTIGVMEDATYDPPASQLETLPCSLLDKLRNDLKLPAHTLQHRCARAAMLMASLQHIKEPLSKAAFDPFQEDFDKIRANYRALEREIDHFAKRPAKTESEDILVQSVEGLLKQIYAYISWGIRHQADSEQQVDQILMELGFRIPPVRGQPLFDTVAPAALLVAAIAAVFWAMFYFAQSMAGAYGPEPPNMSIFVVPVVASGISAAAMYGGAIFIALKQRAQQIDRRTWCEGSAICLTPIAVKAGLLAWGVIAITTILADPLGAANSLVALVQAFRSLAHADQAQLPADWYLPGMLLSAMPWFVAGATVGVQLARCVGRHLTRQSKIDWVRDMVRQALGLGCAAALAQLVQGSLQQLLLHQQFAVWPLVPIVGLVGAGCGAVIGWMVPHACRANIVEPPDRTTNRELQDLLGHAERALGDKVAAVNWSLEGRPELGGIAAAEAVHYRGLATSVFRMLDDASGAVPAETQPRTMDRPSPTVIEGGLSATRRAK